MNKSILVIDTPTKCEYCPLLDTTDIVHNDGDYAYCHALQKPLKNTSITQFISIRKPKNCPLKPMPKRMLTLAKINNGEILNNNEIQYMKGRNDCLDEILGEQE